jgi:hypothetical protein
LTFTAAVGGAGLAWFNFIQPYLQAPTFLVPRQNAWPKNLITATFSPTNYTVSGYGANFPIGQLSGRRVVLQLLKETAVLASDSLSDRLTPIDSKDPLKAVTPESKEKAQSWSSTTPAVSGVFT